MTRSPLYSIYGETITGVAVVRAFGASSKFLRDMLRFTDTVCRSTVPLMFADDELKLSVECQPILLAVGRFVFCSTSILCRLLLT